MQKTGKCICKSSTKDAVYFNETFKGCKSSIYANITADTEVRVGFSAVKFSLSVTTITIYISSASYTLQKINDIVTFRKRVKKR